MAVNSFLDPTKLKQVQQNYTTTFNTVNNLDNNYLSLSGGTVTGAVLSTYDGEITDNAFVTKKYVDDNVGGGGSAYTETVLWSNPDISGNPLPTNPIELSDNLSNYDAIYIMGGQYTNGRFYPIAIGTIQTSHINSSTDFVWNYSDTFYGLNYTDDTHIGLLRVAGGTNIAFKEVIGIKYGGGVKGRNVTSLYHGNSLANSITLNDAYTNYDEIIITSNTGVQINSTTYNVDDINANNLIGIWTNAGYIGYTVTSDTVLTLSGSSGIDYIADIYGVKYDSDYITIDTEMSSTSTNPVQNKTIKEYVDAQIAAITDYVNKMFPNA